MTYYFSKTLDMPFAEAIAAVTAALQAKGFGILTEIDVQATLKNKLDADFKPYRILGACNPPLAYQALQAEDKVGLLMPCNVVVEDAGQGRTEVSAVDPVASMSAVDNPALREIAGQVRELLQAAVAGL